MSKQNKIHSAVIIVFLAVFLTFLNTNPCSAETVESQYIVKNVTMQEFSHFFENYLKIKDYCYSKSHNIYTVHPPSNPEIGFLYNIFGDYDFKIKLTETPIGVELDTSAEVGKFGESYGYKSAKFLVFQISKIKPVTTIEGFTLKVSDIYKPLLLAEKKIALQSKKIDVSKYSKVDPEFKENTNIALSILKPYRDFKKGNKTINVIKNYKDNSIETYMVSRDKESLIYDKKGNLKEIIILNPDRESYPKLSLSYGYPDGMLKRSTVSLSEHNSYEFGENGDIIDFSTFMSKLHTKIKSNWNPERFDTSCKTVVLFKLSKDGKLLNYMLKESSCDSALTNKAINAINLSAPFDPLPAGYQDDYIDIEYHFDLNVLRR